RRWLRPRRWLALVDLRVAEDRPRHHSRDDSAQDPSTHEAYGRRRRRRGSADRYIELVVAQRAHCLCPEDQLFRVAHDVRPPPKRLLELLPFRHGLLPSPRHECAPPRERSLVVRVRDRLHRQDRRAAWKRATRVPSSGLRGRAETCTATGERITKSF